MPTLTFTLTFTFIFIFIFIFTFTFTLTFIFTFTAVCNVMAENNNVRWDCAYIPSSWKPRTTRLLYFDVIHGYDQSTIAFSGDIIWKNEKYTLFSCEVDQNVFLIKTQLCKLRVTFRSIARETYCNARAPVQGPRKSRGVPQWSQARNSYRCWRARSSRTRWSVAMLRRRTL